MFSEQLVCLYSSILNQLIRGRCCWEDGGHVSEFQVQWQRVQLQTLNWREGWICYLMKAVQQFLLSGISPEALNVNMNKEILLNKFLIFLLIIFIYNICMCVFLRQTCTINQLFTTGGMKGELLSYSCIKIHLCMSHLDNLSRSFWRCTSAPFNQLSRTPAALFHSWNSLVFDYIQSGSTFFVVWEEK